jgi:hypothetical protein
MESGTQSPATTEALNEIYRAILKFQSHGTGERLVLPEILRHVDRISEAGHAGVGRSPFARAEIDPGYCPSLQPLFRLSLSEHHS